ncbi:hypothetical protein EXE59_12830 [Nocardioides eburneiflavus]|uniref:DUF2946 domain-containing protein n=1 Tax=Nocardioides eburneiflavus TaxID=2518372 RepID=A0A4Z1CK13_9ACTN|nr:hypothetical protein [Nocardioides eburneiflavus]TGN64743.1 hypothetical protein EXE59_12830 [Nocardioides eburneiflavus]
MTRTWWAAAALLAIFAMHGLATHAGAAGPAALPAPAVEATAASHTSHAAHRAHPAHPADPAQSAPVGDDVLADAAPWSPTSHAGDHGAMQVLGLCLTVLATAAIALLMLVRTRPGLVALLPRAAGSRTPPTAATHDLGPPDLHFLSILRC